MDFSGRTCIMLSSSSQPELKVLQHHLLARNEHTSINPTARIQRHLAPRWRSRSFRIVLDFYDCFGIWIWQFHTHKLRLIEFLLQTSRLKQHHHTLSICLSDCSFHCFSSRLSSTNPLGHRLLHLTELYSIWQTSFWSINITNCTQVPPLHISIPEILPGFDCDLMNESFWLQIRRIMSSTLMHYTEVFDNFLLSHCLHEYLLIIYYFIDQIYKMLFIIYIYNLWILIAICYAFLTWNIHSLQRRQNKNKMYWFIHLLWTWFFKIWLLCICIFLGANVTKCV